MRAITKRSIASAAGLFFAGSPPPASLSEPSPLRHPPSTSPPKAPRLGAVWPE